MKKASLMSAALLSVIIGVSMTFPNRIAANAGDQNTGNGNRHWREYWEQYFREWRNRHKENDFCAKHPEHQKCNISVPEFGLIPGIVAVATSAGSYLVMRKKEISS